MGTAIRQRIIGAANVENADTVRTDRYDDMTTRLKIVDTADAIFSFGRDLTHLAPRVETLYRKTASRWRRECWHAAR